MMDRNLDRRVEAVVPIESTELEARLREILRIELADDALAWCLAGDGVWHKVPVVEGLNAQHRLQDLAVSRSKRRVDGEPMVAHPDVAPSSVLGR
jgi:polyphosphate kinase